MIDRRPLAAAVAAFVVLAVSAGPLGAAVPRTPEEYRARIEAERATNPVEDPYSPLHRTPCVGGMAGPYPCDGIDLMEFLPLASFPGATNTNSLWGWTDPVTGKEWVLLGLDNGTAFLDISDPENPYFAGRLPQHPGSSPSLWRDVRVYRDHAFVVSEANNHGMQVFDLRQLRTATGPPDVFAETKHYNRVSNTHTISINEATGHAVLVGTTGPGSPNCGGNLHIVDLDQLLAILLADFEEGNLDEWTAPPPSGFAGCYDDGGYVHENQCFVYHGPDAAYTGHEICLAARGFDSTIDIVDITDPAAPVRLDSFDYQPSGFTYSHQAWFTEDHRYILLNDEFDESDNGHNTRTWIFDASDLNNVGYAGPNGYYSHTTTSVDHNEYVRGSFLFQSNYTAGLRILELTNLDQDQLTPVAFFDVYPTGDPTIYDGSWNNYPFFASGIIPVSHIEQGLFLVEPTNLCTAPPVPTALAATPNGDNRIDLAWTGSGQSGETFRVERALGGCAGTFLVLAEGVTGTAYSDLSASGGVTYGYRVRAQRESGLCNSDPSTCVTASTSGVCTAPPLFAGLESASSPGTEQCAVELGWSPAQVLCGSEAATYSVYRSPQPDFTPTAADRIAQGITSTGFVDAGAPSQTTVHYVVRAVHGGNGAEESNNVHGTARAEGPVGDGTYFSGAELGEPIFEAGAMDSPEHAGWHVESHHVRTGERSYTSLPGAGTCSTLETDVELSGAPHAPALEFWSVSDSDPASGGGVVELSTDGGASWQRLNPAGGYPTTYQGTGTLCGIAPGAGVVSGSGLFEFVPFWFDLAPWTGQSVRLRWVYRSDDQETGEGWTIDDAGVLHAQVPGACTNP
jgi:choice-of-anchor B domain-containing protein